jgi:hypothetical protein
VAHRKNIPMAAAIAQVLDAAEEQQFWDAVRRAHATMTTAQRESDVPDATITDVGLLSAVLLLRRPSRPAPDRPTLVPAAEHMSD